MVESVEFTLDELLDDEPPTGAPSSTQVRITSMAEAARVHRLGEELMARYDLGRAANLDSPLFDHHVLGFDVVTNNTGAFLASVARNAWFVHGASRTAFSTDAASLGEVETALLEQADRIFGPDFLRRLAEQSRQLRSQRIDRLELLRCVVSQMKGNSDLSALAFRMDSAITSARLPRRKHT